MLMFVSVLIFPLLSLIKALVNVHGNVVCKEKCDSSVSITLLRLAEKHTEEKAVSLTDESNGFVFQDIIPGKYRLEVQCHC